VNNAITAIGSNMPAIFSLFIYGSFTEYLKADKTAKTVITPIKTAILYLIKIV